MARAGFDYGEKPVSGGKTFKNPTVGKHPARLRSIIHLGLFQEEFKGKLKDPAPFVCAVFELKDDEDFNEDGSPMTYSKSFPLRDGDKAFLSKFLKALDKDEKASSFDELIGSCCELDLTGSEDLGDDGLPKYVNLKADGISSLHPKLAALTDELSVAGVGHCKFADLTKEAILELHPIRDVADTILSENNHSYANSKAAAIIAEIRKEDKDFAVRKVADAKAPAAKGNPAKNSAPAADEPPSTPPAQLAADEEF